MLLILLLALMAIGFAYLLVESARLDRHRKAIPMVIAVTGTRGKSSVTRMLAAVLRRSGRRVVAKTTGAEASLILPDGSEREIRRRGRPSIIEQKHVVGLGADLGVNAAVVEVMAIHSENHLVEAQRLLKPDLVVVTNFRVDHTSAMGDTREAVASVLALDVPPGARAFVPQQESLPQFREALGERAAQLVEVPAGVASALPEDDGDSHVNPFGENQDLVYAVARSLDIDDATIREGIRRVELDVGALRVWRYQPADLEAPCFFVNAFAANDPESTGLVHNRVTTALGADAKRCVGLLNLRSDRGDRTLQWLEALRSGFLGRLGHLYVLGLHARALKRRLRGRDDAASIEVLRGGQPAEITRTVLSGMRGAGGGMVFGFGNIGGAGEGLATYWNEIGEPWGIGS